MYLVGVKEDNGWLISRWNLTYKVGWKHICKGISSVYEYYDKPEVLTNNVIIDIDSKNEILNIEENSNLTLRGISKIIKVPVMITFVNQTQIVEVNVPMMGEEFSTADYKKFNTSLCQYMDSIELAMYR